MTQTDLFTITRSRHNVSYAPAMPVKDAVAKGQQAAEACTEAQRRECGQDWPERAYSALCAYIATRKAFKPGEPWSGEQAVEFVLRQPGIEQPSDARALGSLFSRASRAKLIARSATLFPRRHGHGSQTPGWIAL
jgi:hypothetical protein